MGQNQRNGKSEISSTRLPSHLLADTPESSDHPNIWEVENSIQTSESALAFLCTFPSLFKHALMEAIHSRRRIVRKRLIEGPGWAQSKGQLHQVPY
jgi:hypothetical protein